MKSKMALTHNELIEAQYNILELLATGKPSKFIAQKARELIDSTYRGKVVATGAELGISVNDLCNLSCGHCYYASTHDKSLIQRDYLLSTDEWKKVVNDALRAGIKHISIIGKEPLLSPDETFTILETLHQAKHSFMHDIEYEMITNGTLIAKHIEQIATTPDFSFFSVSVDGYREHHDKVRGEGTYEKTMHGLTLLREAGIKNRTVITTAMPHNVDTLDRMIEDVAEHGAEFLTIGLCFPTEYNDHELNATLDVYDKVLQHVICAPDGLNITIGILADEHTNLLAALWKRGDIQKENLAVTQDFAPALYMPISDNPRVAVQISVLPVMFYSGFRIDCTGAALDYCTDLRTPETRKGFGNVKNQSCKELYGIARNKLWVPYTEEYYRRLANVFAGKDVGIVQWPIPELEH